MRKEPSPIRDVDWRDRFLLWKRVIFALVGGLAGGSLGYNAVHNSAGFLVGCALGAVTSWHYIELWGRFSSKVYFPSGSTTPYKHQYSQALALLMQGKVDAAIAEFERDIAEEPKRTDGYLHLARLYRDHLQRYDEALAWFKRARNEADISPGEDMLVTREVFEVYAHKLNEPRRAMPELARLVEKYPDSPAAEWARAELKSLRDEMSSS
jgi:hypothetical protein